MRRLATTLLLALLGVTAGVTSASAAPGDVTLPVCSAAVHDSYKVTGPDGVQYATWHPQIDQANNCHFDHEHGSNPVLIGQTAYNYQNSILPAFGYTVAKHGMTEGHAGFKVAILEYGNHTFMFTVHFGTANPQIAVCERFHTVDLVIVDEAGAVKADLHLMGDFGKATSQAQVNLTPTACPNQANVGASTGQRTFPVETENEVAYEPWRLDSRPLSALGFRSGGFTVNTTDPQKMCNAITCDAGVVMDAILGVPSYGPARGANRLVTFNDGGANGNFRIDGTVTGNFCTDPMGSTTVSCGETHAVKQYVAPGFSITVQTPLADCRQGISTGTDGQYWCNTNLPNEVQNKLNRLVTGVN